MSNKKDDSEVPANKGIVMDKTKVTQEARVFNESPISPRKCRIILTKIMYLLYTGGSFTVSEATSLFFGITKLFQNNDAALRQMTYIVLKELSGTAESVMIATASISKDMQSNQDYIYRPNAIRALYKVSEPSMIQGLERFYKAAIVDKNSSIASAALVSAYHMQFTAKDVIKRWAAEASEALSSASRPNLSSASAMNASLSAIVQYHSLGLLYHIREKDKMAITKMVQQLAAGKSGSNSSAALRNPMAVCMLIRYAAKIMRDDPNTQRQMQDIIEGFLRHKSDMVNLEAARALCESKNPTAESLIRPVSVLQLLLSSPKSTLKFAAIRTLNALSQKQPELVQNCNVDMEALITDSNRSIATYAITTLLKTGNEASVDRLMKQISTFMAEISDEFKVIVIDAIRALCMKFPAKQGVMLSFLSGVLRDEGGYDFKKAVVEAIFDLVEFVSDAKDSALAHLCEFIEDCEFTKLSVRILHLLGVEGPKTPNPTKYIRYIYNRVVLENAVVRAAAVSSLAKFGVNVEQKTVKQSIKVLLRRCLDDVDDEVRDRAVLYLSVLDNQEEKVEKMDDSSFSLESLEEQLTSYLGTKEGLDVAFDATSVPRVSRKELKNEALRVKNQNFVTAAPIDVSTIDTSISQKQDEVDSRSDYSEVIGAISQFSSYGPVLQSSQTAQSLTESETEYIVTVVKHIMKDYIIFQFNVSNTVPDFVLEDVAVLMTPSGDEELEHLEEDKIIPAVSITSNNSPACIYVAYRRKDPSSFAMGSFSNTMIFTTKEVDPSSGLPQEDGYKDEYQIESVSLDAADYIKPAYASFASEWEAMSDMPSCLEVFSLAALENLKAACSTLVELLNMEPLGGTDQPISSSVHTLEMSGIVAGGGGKVLVRSRMTYSVAEGVAMEMNVRAESQAVCDLVINAIE